MKCPSCKSPNIAGVDSCEKCGQNLTSDQGYKPKSEIEAGLIQNPITSLKPRAAITTNPKSSIFETVQLINDNKSSVLVIDDNQLVGIVTERDVLYKAVHQNLDLKSIPVTTIMTANPEVLHADDSIAHALHLMSVGGFRNIPIVQNQQLAYVVSIWDILRYFSEKGKI